MMLSIMPTTTQPFPDDVESLKAMLAEKRAQFEAATASAQCEDEGDFPDGAQLCVKCHTKAAIQMDGCLTCLNCGESKCG